MITKEQLGTFSEIHPFSDDLLKVKRRNKYNLININTGEYVSDKWFENINKSNGGGFDIETKVKNKTVTRQYSSMASYNHECSLAAVFVSLDVIPAYLDAKDIIVLATPISITSCGKSISVIAEVTYMGNKYYLDKNGVMYYTNGTVYEYADGDFSISMAQINRLTNRMRTLNKILNPEFDPNSYVSMNNGETQDKHPGWAFGFSSKYSYGDDEYVSYNTSYKNTTHMTQTEPWGHKGEDSIKIRFSDKLIASFNREKCVDYFNDNGYAKWEGNSIFGINGQTWYTIEFRPSEIDNLYKELSTIENMVTAA